MGEYNPSAPFVVGNEWVGIRDENVQFSPEVNVVEYGHTFHTDQAYILNDGRFYVRDMPPNTDTGIWVISVYPQGDEGRSGPVKRLVMPTETAFVTGASVTSQGAVEALLTPYFGGYIALDTDLARSDLIIGFNTAPYTILDGKRILKVSLLYNAYAAFATDPGDSLQTCSIYLTDDVGQFSGTVYGTGREFFPVNDTSETVQRLSLGEICQLWQSPATTEMLPWTFADLRRFDSSIGGTKLYVRFSTGSNYSAPANGTIYIWYAALEVLYCEEQRAILGGNYRAAATNDLQYGANIVTLRTVDRQPFPQLDPGDWTVTISATDQGDTQASDAGFPDLNGLRELYEIPSHAGVQINLSQTEGREFEVIQTHILPQISLHTSGAALTEVHSYGRQWAAPVYGAVIPIQEIYDDVIGGTADYAQVRFYARHWTATTEDLIVSGIGTAAGVAASISVDDFDALDEILDGWKEVTLRLNTSLTMGALSPDPRFAWLSVGERAGSHWEILAVQAPAVSGIPGDLLQLVVPSGQRLGPTTYEPPVGSTVELTTISTTASGAASGTAQIDTDACFMLSQDPYTVTGLSVETLSQTVTGIGPGCDDGNPCCIPTSISYHRITWPTLAMSSSGFGAFELQRYDTVTDDWQTIMSASSAAVTGFNDFEARVGQASVYRIRILNLYRFAGAWSDQVTGTITGTGVEMSCSESDPIGVLIFTSNSDQSGVSNLAYAMQFDRSVEEAFAFEEASQVQRRRHYRRDYVTAYRPTERGGETFSRVLLVQGAAGALPNMANMRSLRDLGWADLPYICVRDELGNRWFADVVVPAGTISQRSLYLATVDIAEVTATPTEVDP